MIVCSSPSHILVYKLVVCPHGFHGCLSLVAKVSQELRIENLSYNLEIVTDYFFVLTTLTFKDIIIETIDA